MRSVVLLSIFASMFISCQMEPKTPVAQPQDFDHKAYADNLKNNKRNLSSNLQTEESLVDTSEFAVPEKQLPSLPADTIFLKAIYGVARIDTAKLANQKLVFVLNTDTARHLEINLSTQDSLAPLQIDQIIDENGNASGSFEKSVRFPIEKQGIHRIILDASSTQNDRWEGSFQLEAKLIW